MLSSVIKAVSEQSGLMQTDLYKLFPDTSKESLRYVLYFAEDHGHVIRKKKGRSYELYCVGEDE